MGVMLRILVTVVVGMISFGSSSAQEYRTLRFVDRFSDVETTDPPICLLPKGERLSAHSAKFNVNIDPLIPDSVATCINVAIDIWSGRLRASEPINLRFVYENFSDDIDVITDVIYVKPYDEPYGKPSALYKQSNSDVSNIDASISINKQRQWECNHTHSVGENKNLTTAMLRAVGVALGFGSSVTQRENAIVFQESYKSVFDGLIVSSEGKHLCDMNTPAQLSAFVQPPQSTTIFAQAGDQAKYKLYSPRRFEWGRSLVYLDSKSSLMHHELSPGEKKFQIDNTTIDLLNAIGWDIQRQGDVEIMSDKIPDTGICSAYNGYDFRIRSNLSGALTGHQWSYTLPLLNGSDTTICVQTGQSRFSIPAVDNIKKYKVNVNGDIPGEIVYTGTINGKSVKDVFHLYLEREPIIKNVKVKNIWLNPDKPTYTLFFDVEYSGASSLVITVEEDQSVGANTFYVREPFYAHVTARNIAVGYYAWIEVVASNEYGYSSHTIEMAPPLLNTDPVMPRPGVGSEILIEGETLNSIYVHDINGTFVTVIERERDLRDLAPGFYILRYFKGNQCVKQSKYLR